MEETEDIEKKVKQFLNLSTKRDIADFFGIKYPLFIYVVYKQTEEDKYKVFYLKKKNGANREISAPNKNIKILQKKLSLIIYEIHKPKSCSHGFLRGKSIKTNAKEHSGKRYVLNIDLRDFFGSINFGRVLGMFKAYPFKFNDNVAPVLAKICCYKGVLPQGSPCSPIISDIISITLDKRMLQFAKEKGLYYSRYADDITFSTNEWQKISNIVTVCDEEINLSEELIKLIEISGFFVNKEKVRLRDKTFQRNEVTGLTVNKFPNIKKVYLRNKIRGLLHAIDKYGIKKAQEYYNLIYDDRQGGVARNADLFQVLNGRINFLKFIRKELIEKKQKKSEITIGMLNISRVEAKFKDLIIRESVCDFFPQDYSKYGAIVVTEGKTDWMHLKAALRSLGINDLNIYICEIEGKKVEMNESKLYKFCEDSKYRIFDTKVLCMFDSDVEHRNDQVTVKGFKPKRWSESLYSFIIPTPSHRTGEIGWSIEFYYSDAEITTIDSDGKRLVFIQEIEKVKSEKKKYILKRDVNINQIVNKKIAVDNIDNIYDEAGKNVAISKTVFASRILNREEGFDKFNFNEFNNIFDLIKGIIVGNYE